MCEATNKWPSATAIAPWGRKWSSLVAASSSSSLDLVLLVLLGREGRHVDLQLRLAGIFLLDDLPYHVAIDFRRLIVGSFLTHFSMALATAACWPGLISMAHNSRSLVVVIGRL